MLQEEEIRNNIVTRVAEEMLTAARTAPKAKGIDNLVLAMVIGSDIELIAKKMEEIGNSPEGTPSFIRDAGNIRKTQTVVLMGTRIKSQGVKICGRCGFKDCDEKDEHPDSPCTFNVGDLGIAIGSAVSLAMDHRVDNRVMYTIGQAVLEMKLLGDDVKIAFGIPLSVSAKSPFFDR
ncbi:MAG: DUF2148 domain-containing protein [Bacteroidales bacterium]|jgi:uncharacterized ferredoxin-like protein